MDGLEGFVLRTLVKKTHGDVLVRLAAPTTRQMVLKCFNYSLEVGYLLEPEEFSACSVNDSTTNYCGLQHRDASLQEHSSSRFVCYAANLLFVEALLQIPSQRR